MQDAVAVSLEAGAHGVGRLFDAPRAGAVRVGGAGCQARSFEFFALKSRADVADRHADRAVAMREPVGAGRLTFHCRCPSLGSFCRHDDHSTNGQ